MNPSDVTIIIPIYVFTESGLEWLVDCLDSATNQEGASVVAYNDGSKVDITRVISKYIKRLVYAAGEHVGVSHARNQAASLVATELLLPLDCDDRFKEGTVSKLLEYWNGITPVYPDVCKFGDVNDPHYPILDFHCEHLYNHVGFTSVNVLHKKSQWAELGGWDESIDFFEDGEYNNRLMCLYGGRRCPEPLIEYRMHSDQRTVQRKKGAHDIAKSMLNKIRSNNMPCPGCGGRSSQMLNNSTGEPNPYSQQSSPLTNVNVKDIVATVPLEFNGMVLAVYIGGQGKGDHYYQGRASKMMYKVEYGNVLYVRPEDARLEDDKSSMSLFIRIEQQREAPKPPVVIPGVESSEEAEEEATVKVSREAKKPVARKPAK